MDPSQFLLILDVLHFPFLPSNDKVEKLKKFGKIFKKEKFKMKNTQQKENIRYVIILA